MLAYLSVANLALLEEAAIEPADGLTVITGETGAGKTLLLGALRLLLGGKADPGSVGPFGDESRVNGLFRADEDEFGVSRRIPRDGRSQAFIEGNIVSAEALRDLVGSMVEIAGQHDHLAIRRPSTLLDLVDGLVGELGTGVLEEYARAWARFTELKKDQMALGGDLMVLQREIDLAVYQSQEISGGGLDATSDEEVASLAARLRNHESMTEHTAAARRDIDDLSDIGGRLLSRLRALAQLDPSLEGASLTAESVFDGVHDLGRAVEIVWSELAEAETSSEDMEKWLNAVGDLKRKYGRTIQEVVDFGRQAQKRADELSARLERSTSIESDLEEALSRLEAAATELSDARRLISDELVGDAASHLADLGLAEARLRIEFSPAEPGVRGADHLSLAFSSDERLRWGDVSEVASGGELSRLVLALRLAVRSEGLGCMVFDEVDAGIGGATALALGAKLSKLAATTQVIVVTHLPQVAAFADRHYLVERGAGSASVRLVEGEDRLAELARMLSGMPESEGGRDTAFELLSAAGR